jgi:C4-type Zn-finger protein
MTTDAPTCPQCKSIYLWLIHFFDIRDDLGHKVRLFCRACGYQRDGVVQDEKEKPR